VKQIKLSTGSHLEYTDDTDNIIDKRYKNDSWFRGTVVEHLSVTGEFSLSYTRPAANG